MKVKNVMNDYIPAIIEIQPEYILDVFYISTWCVFRRMCIPWVYTSKYNSIKLSYRVHRFAAIEIENK